MSNSENLFEKNVTPKVQRVGREELAKRSELVLDERRRIRRRLTDLCREGEELIIRPLETRLVSVMMFCPRSATISPNVLCVS